MIGNSLKSHILPVLVICGDAVHIPFHTTCIHEKIDHKVVHKTSVLAKKMYDVLKKLQCATE